MIKFILLTLFTCVLTQTTGNVVDQDRIKKGIEWLLSRRLPDKGWDNRNTGRAIMALQLAKTSSGRWTDYGGLEARMSIKQLENEILASLSRDRLLKDLDDASLLSYLNALTATCHDIRNFYGHDLLRILEVRMTSFKNLLQYSTGVLTLCTAGQRIKDSYVGTMLSQLRPLNGPNCLFCNEIRSGVILALSCVQSQSNERNEILERAIDDLVNRVQQRQQEDGGFGGTFPTAIAINALQTVKVATPEQTTAAYNYLYKEQKKETGSFVNVLIATVVLSAVGGQSYLSVGRNDCPPPELLVPDVGPGMIFTRYRIEDSIRNAFNISGSVAVPEGTSVHQIMNSLSAESPGSFQYEVEDVPGPFRQIVITQLNGLRANPKQHLIWNIYREQGGPPVRSNTGVAYAPENNELVVIRFERT